MAFFEKLGETLTKNGQDAIQKGKNFAEITRLNSISDEQEVQIKNLCCLVGEKYVELNKGNYAAEMQGWIEEIEKLKCAIEDNRERINQLRGVNKCPNCGAEINANVRFCGYCGHEIIIQPVVEVVPVQDKECCPNCGAPTEINDLFCKECGTKLTSVTAESEQMITDNQDTNE